MLRQRRRMFFASFRDITFQGCLLENANGALTFSSVGLFPTRELLNRCWGGNLIRRQKPMREKGAYLFVL